MRGCVNLLRTGQDLRPEAGAVARTVIPASGRRVICGLVSEGASTWASNVRLNVRTERLGDVLEESSSVLALRAGQ